MLGTKQVALATIGIAASTAALQSLAHEGQFKGNIAPHGGKAGRG